MDKNVTDEQAKQELSENKYDSEAFQEVHDFRDRMANKGYDCLVVVDRQEMSTIQIARYANAPGIISKIYQIVDLLLSRNHGDTLTIEE